MSIKSLNSLIETLKAEGIEAAEQQASQIVQEAQQKAREIVHNAQQKRQEVQNEAEKEAKRIIENGQAVLQQAARDLSIKLKNEMLQMLNRVLQQEVQEAFSPQLLQKVILQVIENTGNNIELELPDDYRQNLAAYIQQRLQSNDLPVFANGQDNDLRHFNIRHKDEGWSYDISPEAVSELLKDYLTEPWSNMIQSENPN